MLVVKSMEKLGRSEKAILFALYHGGGALARKEIAKHLPAQMTDSNVRATLNMLNKRHAVTLTTSAGKVRATIHAARLTDMAVRWIENNQGVFNGFAELVATYPYRERPPIKKLYQASGQKKTNGRPVTEKPTAKRRPRPGEVAARFLRYVDEHPTAGTIHEISAAYAAHYGITHPTTGYRMRDLGYIARNTDGVWVVTNSGVPVMEREIPAPADAAPVESDAAPVESDAAAVADALLDKVLDLIREQRDRPTADEWAQTTTRAAHAEIQVEKLQGQLAAANQQYTNAVAERDRLASLYNDAQAQITTIQQELANLSHGPRKIRQENLRVLRDIASGQ